MNKNKISYINLTTSSAPPAIPTAKPCCPARRMAWPPSNRRKNLETATKMHEWTGTAPEAPHLSITSHVA